MPDPTPIPDSLPGPQGSGPGKGLDCETAVLYRAVLGPVFDRAETWPALVERLAAKGFGLAIRGGRLMLTRTDSGGAICTARFLGHSLSDLAQRLGKPAIVPCRGRIAAGEFRIKRSGG